MVARRDTLHAVMPMIDPKPLQTWELWYPGGGATGLPFARGRLDPTDLLWVHSAPKKLEVTVRTFDERLVARGSTTLTMREFFALQTTRRSCKPLISLRRWPTTPVFTGKWRR